MLNKWFDSELFYNFSDFLIRHKRSVKFSIYVGFVCYLFYGYKDLFYNPQCLVEMTPEASKIFREPESCDFCQNVTRIDKLANVSPQKFHKDYVKTGQPVVVTDGTRDWSATTVFTFEFFKKIYETVDDKYTGKSCQFFPYKTEFRNLREVFAMPESRSKLAPGEKPWYVGWSNCNNKAGKVLRKYYSKPYFLGNFSENIALSWIFMGGPGYGAQMHVDNVVYSSWQAQLSGRKLWKLAPPPECYNVCSKLEVLVEPGEIIVVDTNRWYHQTIVAVGDISITIGSEFD